MESAATSLDENPLFDCIRRGGSLRAAFDSADFEACYEELISHRVLKSLCTPTIRVLSGHTATFLSSTGELDGPVVLEEDSPSEASTRVNGLEVDLRFVPTVIDSEHIQLQVSAPFLPMPEAATESEMNDTDRPVAQGAVELQKGQVLAASGKICISKPAESGRGGIGAVPVLGQLFRNKRPVTQETELIVVATAEIVDDQEPQKVAREPSGDEPKSR